MKSNRIIKYIENNYVYLSTFFLSLIVLVICNIMCGCVPYGENFPISGNGFIQDYTQYVQTVENIKAGKGVGILDYGIGLLFDNYGSRSYSVLFLFIRPWLYIAYLLVPESMYIDVFSTYYYFFFVCSGILFIYFLTHRKYGKALDKKNPRLIVLGLAYSLSAFSTNYYIYGGFRFMLFIPLIFLGIEYLVYEKKPLLYIVSLFYCMSSEAYYAFIMCIFIFLYFLLLEHNDIKTFFRRVFYMAVASVCAAGLSAAFLIPYFIRTRYSPYGSDDNVTPSILSWFGNIIYPLSDFRPFREGIVTTPQEFRTNIYCGLLVLLLLPLYFSLKNIKKSEKIKKTIFLVFVYLAFDNQLINFIIHGFHHQWQVPNRFACFFVFVILLVFNDILDEFNSFTSKRIIVSVLISTALLTVVYLISANSGAVDGFSIEKLLPVFLCLFIYIVISGIYLIKNGFPFYKVALILMCIELVVGGVYSLQSVVGYEGSEETLKYAGKIKKLNELCEDMKTPFVITERPGTNDDQNIAYLSDTHSISYYTSTSYKQELDLLHRWGVLFSTNLTYYTTGSPLADMMLHVKYHITDSEDQCSISPYSEIATCDNLVLHQNSLALPLGVVINRNDKIDSWNNNASEYSNAFERENAFAKAFGIDDIYNQIDIIEISDISEATDPSKNYFIVMEDESEGATFVFLAGEETTGALYMQISNSLQYIGTANEGTFDTLYFYAPRTVYKASKGNKTFGVCNSNNIQGLYNVLSKTVMTDTQYDSRQISGKVKSEEEGLLYLAMPNLPGFKAYVDGTEQNITDYLDGIALNIQPGEHIIELKYTPEGMWIGIIITSIFLLILCGYCLYLYKHIEDEDIKKKINHRLCYIYMILALVPFPMVFTENTHAAFKNAWFIILTGIIVFFALKMWDKKVVIDKKLQLLEVFMTAVLLFMLPIGDVINNDEFISLSIIFQMWKWLIYIPALIVTSWIIVHSIIQYFSGKEADNEKKESSIFGLDLGMAGCSVIIALESLVFLFSTNPGIFMDDDVLRVLLRILEDQPSDWDTYGYLLFVKLFTANGTFLYGVNIFQTVIWILVNIYILSILNKWSRKALHIYTIIAAVSIAPMVYLEVMFKDTIFSIGILALTAGIFNVIRKKSINIVDVAVLGIASLPTSLCRKGGFVATFIGILVVGIYLLIYNKKDIKKYVAMPLIHILSYVLIYSVLFNINNVKAVDPYVKYGTPISIIGYAVSEGVQFNDEDTEMLEKVMDLSEWDRCHDKYWVDSIARTWGNIEMDNLVKLNNLVKDENYGSFILKLNAKLLIQHPIVWFDAFLAMGNQIWEISTPYDMKYSGIKDSPICNAPHDDNISYSFLFYITDFVTKLFDRITVLHSLFYRGGFAMFILILMVCIMCVMKHKKYAFVFLPVLAYMLILFLAIPAPDVRYVLPVLETVGLAVAIVVGIKNQVGSISEESGE